MTTYKQANVSHIQWYLCTLHVPIFIPCLCTHVLSTIIWLVTPSLLGHVMVLWLKQISWSLNWFILNPDFLFLIHLTSSTWILIFYIFISHNTTWNTDVADHCLQVLVIMDTGFPASSGSFWPLVPIHKLFWSLVRLWSLAPWAPRLTSALDYPYMKAVQLLM